MINLDLFQKAFNKLEKKFGPFDLFALFLRTEAPGVWDLVISAPWLGDRNSFDLKEFIKALKEVIGKEEMVKLSRIYPIPLEDEGLQIILRKVGDVDGIKEIRDETFYQVEVERGYVFKANTALLQVEQV